MIDNYAPPARIDAASAPYRPVGGLAVSSWPRQIEQRSCLRGDPGPRSSQPARAPVRSRLKAGSACRSADALVILDVLQYIDYCAHSAVLESARAALSPEGLPLLRVSYATADLRFRIARWVDRAVLLARGHLFNQVISIPRR